MVWYRSDSLSKKAASARHRRRDASIRQSGQPNVNSAGVPPVEPAVCKSLAAVPEQRRAITARGPPMASRNGRKRRRREYTSAAILAAGCGGGATSADHFCRSHAATSVTRSLVTASNPRTPNTLLRALPSA
jgi:hypothetical protein